MNIPDINNNINAVIDTLKNIKNEIKYNKKSLRNNQSKFGRVLKKILNILSNDNIHPSQGYLLDYIANRIVQYDILVLKIKKIQYIKKSNRRNETKVIDAVKNKIHNLIIYANMFRLPFTKGTNRYLFYKNTKAKINDVSLTNIFFLEKEFFHLLSNNFDIEYARAFERKYGGSIDLLGLLGWSNVLNQFVKKILNFQGCETGIILLSIIRKAIPLVAKLAYYYDLINNKGSTDPIVTNDYENEIIYYKSFISLNKSKEVESELHHNDFFETYSLDTQNIIPFNLLQNEISWDIVELINNLQEGEIQILPLGSVNHQVLIQITCIKPESKYQRGYYRYEIFNTGEGIDEYHPHFSNSQNTYVQPLIFDNVPKHVLNYHFFAQLVYIALFESNIKPFYSWHIEVFFSNHIQSNRNHSQHKWHLKQKTGTCSFSCIEAWINSYFNQELLVALKLIKTQTATNKQRKIVQLLEDNSNKDLIPADACLIRSKILLSLGENLFKQAIQEYSSSHGNLELQLTLQD